MIVYHHKKFTKSFAKRITPFSRLENQFKDRWKLFEENPNNLILKDHSLKDNLKGFRAFSVTGDIRLVYKKSGNKIILYNIGTHNQVYS